MQFFCKSKCKSYPIFIIQEVLSKLQILKSMNMVQPLPSSLSRIPRHYLVLGWCTPWPGSWCRLTRSPRLTILHQLKYLCKNLVKYICCTFWVHAAVMSCTSIGMKVLAVVVATDQVARTVSVRVTVSTTQITRVFSSATVTCPFHTIAQLHRLHTAVI